MNFIEVLAKLGIQYVPFLFALCFHEFAHAFVAKKKGDNTAELMGRLTMNPFSHADLIGTFVLPVAGILAGIGGMNGGSGFIFGWAKPVPVNGRALKRPKQDMFWIALAGPLSNLILGFVATFLFVLMRTFTIEASLANTLQTLLGNFIIINVLLAVFNLIPLHPLDGGKVIARFIPDSWSRTLENNQASLQIGLIIFFVAGGFSVLHGPMIFFIGLFEQIAISLVG
ncbi:MAG: hypothetical protein A2Z20_04875 [Bdellovibrionales bacterium RBG_16_40_8]|nr:MAG: hypothetical protein A2Z20_04875 [Bdellovibrionales bacterium RBG_16_40_8]